MAAPKKDIDRVGLEREYRAGVKSLRALGEEFGLAASRIKQIADEEGWVRDLSAKIKAATDSKLNTAILNTNLNAETRFSEKQVVEANSDMCKDIILAHRRDVQRGRNLTIKLLAELEATTDDKELFQQLGELMACPDDKGTDKLNDLYKRVISMPSRVESMKKLSETLKTLIGSEREAFGIKSDVEDAASSIADAIRGARGAG